jgi:hypothetical protein
MRRIVLLAILSAAVSAFDTALAGDDSLRCDIGPVTKTYGKTAWLVYSCADGRTLAIVAAPGNPANPFYFMFYPKEGGYGLYGEGAGRKKASDVAYDQLKTFSEKEIATLIDETKSARKP